MKFRKLENNNPLVNQAYQLEKFPGKGGWTYARIPEVLQDKHAHFGWVRVRGCIDDIEIKNYHLMPMGNGCLFLPVKAEIRKKLKKQAGDFVRIILFADDLPTEIPEELKLCLIDEPNGLENFLNYSNGEQKAFIDWIFSAKTDTTKIDRIVKTLEKISKGLKPNEKNTKL